MIFFFLSITVKSDELVVGHILIHKVCALSIGIVCDRVSPPCPLPCPPLCPPPCPPPGWQLVPLVLHLPYAPRAGSWVLQRGTWSSGKCLLALMISSSDACIWRRRCGHLRTGLIKTPAGIVVIIIYGEPILSRSHAHISTQCRGWTIAHLCFCEFIGSRASSPIAAHPGEVYIVLNASSTWHDTPKTNK